MERPRNMTNAPRLTFLGAVLTAFALTITSPAVASSGPPRPATASAGGAQTNLDGVPGAVAIVPSPQGIHVLAISPSTITLTSGDTFVYSVDTPEGQGRTTLEVKTVAELLDEVTARDGSPQTYTVEDAQGAAKQTTDTIVAGDVLVVTSGKKSNR